MNARRTTRHRRGRRAGQRSASAGIVVLGALVGLFLLSLVWRFRTGSSSEVPSVQMPAQPVRIVVVNGCGKPGLAAVFAEKLRRYGGEAVDVVDLQSAPVMNYEHSVIVGHGEGARWTPYVGALVGCDSAGTKPPTGSENDITIILGNDFQALFPGHDRWWETP